ncbi:MAG: ABC transporter permease [bacterium]
MMLLNYLKLAVRNLFKNKLYAFINILGLAVAVAWSIVAYLNHTYNYTFDTFHKTADQVFRVKTVRLINGQERSWGVVPRPLGPAMAADFPAIDRAARLTRSTAVFRLGDKIFNETVLHADPVFFEMFDFPLKYGSSDGLLRDNSKIVLSEELSFKYFGDVNPVGRQISLRYGSTVPHEFIVSAVTRKIPDNSSIQFDALAALEVLVEVGRDRPNDWRDWAHVLFVQVSDPAQLSTIASRLDRYITAHNAVAPEWQISRFYFDPLRNLAMNAWQENLQRDILKRAMHPAGMISPTIIAALLLLMACFNYINTSIAFSSKRLKEIGIRKVVGGVRRQLIAQFMMDNFLLCAFAFVLALGLAEIFVPLHDSMWTYFELTLDYSENIGLILFLAGLLLFVGLVAGAYPAVYISAYRPVTILRGQQQFGRNSRLSRILLTFQFSVSILTLIASLVFVQNADFLKNMDLGFDKEQVVVVPLTSPRQYEPYRNAIEKHANVLAVAGARHHVQQNWSTQMVESASLQSRADIFAIGHHYISTMKLRLLAGRDFDESLLTDRHESVIVNQKLVHEFRWDEPLGQTIKLGSTRYTVIGVIEDFYNNGAWSPILATVFRLAEPEDFRYIAVRLQPGGVAAASEFLRREWQRLEPDVPYEGFFQDERMAEAISVSESIKTMFLYIAILAIAIAAMGLFALVSLNIARRTKEIGIRKVLGATVLHIMTLMNRDLFWLLLTAAMVASVAGYFTVQALLGSIYSYHVGFSVVPFLLAGFSLFVVAGLTVGWHVLKAALANPVASFRYE